MSQLLSDLFETFFRAAFEWLLHRTGDALLRSGIVFCGLLAATVTCVVFAYAVVTGFTPFAIAAMAAVLGLLVLYLYLLLRSRP